MPLTEKQLEILFKPLNPARVATREEVQEGGKKLKLSYVEAWDEIAHLTRIFGIEGWDKEIWYALAYEENTEPFDAPKPKWCVGYSAKCRLTLKDPEGKVVAVREDLGFGDSVNRSSRGKAHDSAIKEAASDSLKRAAKDLGNQFGLSLYDNGSVKSVVGSSLAYPNIKPKAGEWVWQDYETNGAQS